MIELFIILAIYQIFFIICCFIISLILKRNDIADTLWGIGFIIISVICFYYSKNNIKNILLTMMIFIWGARLSIHIGLRNSKKTEDFRYNNWRKEWKYFYIRSFFQIYFLQGIIMYLISIPIIINTNSTDINLNFIDYTSLAFWLTGFFIQSISDYQLYIFKLDKSNKGKFLKTGLWKYSRHPNYFGEILIWWNIFIFTINYNYIFISIISPILITYLIIFVSGIPMLEEKFKLNPDYENYRKNTNMLIPFRAKY